MSCLFTCLFKSLLNVILDITDFPEPMVPEPFWIICFARPTEVMSLMVLEWPAKVTEGPRYWPTKSASEVGYGNGSAGSSWYRVPEPWPQGANLTCRLITEVPMRLRSAVSHNLGVTFSGAVRGGFQVHSLYFVWITETLDDQLPENQWWTRNTEHFTFLNLSHSRLRDYWSFTMVSLTVFSPIPF